MSSKLSNQFFIKIILTFSLILQTSSQLKFNFIVKDIEPQSKININQNQNLRSNLELPMESEIDTKTIMHTCLGTPPQCFDLIIQTNSFYIMVPDAEVSSLSSKNKYFYSKSLTSVRTSHLITFDFYGEKFKGQEASDILTLDNKKFNRTNFLIISSAGKFSNEDGFIGLGYTPSNEEKKFSIIQQLYENGVIPHKVFSQKYNDGYNGVITLGQIPKHIVDDYMHYGRCKALNKIRKGKVRWYSFVCRTEAG